MASNNMTNVISKLNLVPYSDSEEEEDEEVESVNVDMVMKVPAPFVILDSKTCRNIEESSSSEDESDAESSSSTSSSDFVPEENTRPKGTPLYSKKIKKEIDPEDTSFLPPIELLNISVNNNELKSVGQVLSLVNRLVVIQSTGTPALDMGTALFVEDGTCIGHIFEVFGPVLKPFYSVRFNNDDEIKKLGLSPSTQIYFAPNRDKLTKYVLMHQIRDRGTDASWKMDREAPPDLADYSDDEKEREAKLKRKLKFKATGTITTKVEAVSIENEASNYPGCVDFVPGQWPAIPPPLSNRAKREMKKAEQNIPQQPQQHYISQPNVQAYPPYVTWSPPAQNNFTAPFVGPLPFHLSFTLPPPPPPPPSYCSNNFNTESGFINFDGDGSQKPSS